jgi:site-specific recombinase XerD
MVVVVLPGVKRIPMRLADGSRRVYFYHRATGKRLPDDPASLEFATRLAELNAPAVKTSAAPTDTIAGLIAAYRTSPDFTQLAEKTRKDYRRYLTTLEELWGDMAVKDLRRRHVRALRNAYAKTPRTANYLVQVIRLVMTYAVDEDLREDNPATRPKMLRTGDGHRPWEEDEIADFRQRWKPDTAERVAFELLLNLGQRGGDTIAMTRAHYRKGEVSVKQEKTEARVWVPASDDLIAILDPWLETHQEMMLLINSDGVPFKIDHFRHFMRAAYRAAKISDEVSTHGCRYTAATILHELGCDWETIGAVTGHETAEMVRKYTRKKRRARLAIGLLNRARRNDAET